MGLVTGANIWLVIGNHNEHDKLIYVPVIHARKATLFLKTKKTLTCSCD